MSLTSTAVAQGMLGPRGLELGSPEELEARLTRIRPGDRARGYLFHATLEHVRLYGSDEAVCRCLAIRGEDTPVAFFKYPCASLLRLVYQAAWELKGSSSFEAALYGIGRHVCKHFLENPVGKSFLVMARQSPQQLVEALPVVYRTGWDHGWVELQWLGPKRCLSTLHEGILPDPYLEGILRLMFETVGIMRPRIIIRPLTPFESEFDLSWD